MALPEFGKKHALGILVSVAIGIIFGSHHFLMPRLKSDPNRVYYPIVFNIEFDQTVTYGPRARAVYLDRQSDDISLAENQDQPTILPPLNPMVLSFLAKLAGSMENAFILSDFVFPAIIFLLAYYFLYEIFKKNLLAVAGGILFVFFPAIGALIPPISFDGPKLLSGELFSFINTPGALFFNRFDYPNITYVFYLFALLFVFRAVKYGRTHDIILAGIGAGSLFYAYLYDWVYVLCGIGAMGLIFLLQKNYHRVKILLIIVLIAIGCSAYYWFNFVKLSSLPQYPDIVSRIGTETGAFFRFFTWKTYLRVVSVVLLLWFILKKNDNILLVFLCGLLAPIFIVLNLQVITGFNPQPDHWHRELFFPLFLSWSVFLFWLYNKSNKRFLKSLIVVLIFAAAGFTLAGEAYSQFLYSKNFANEHTISKEYSDSYQWLMKNTNQNSVVATLSPQTNAELLLHTNNKVFYPNGVLTTVSNDEIWKRYMIINALFGVPEEDFAQSISKNQFILLYLFGDYYSVDKSFNRFFKGNPNREASVAEREMRSGEYKKINNNLLAALPMYKIEYVYVDDRIKHIQSDGKFFGDLVYGNGNIKIYKFLK